MNTLTGELYLMMRFFTVYIWPPSVPHSRVVSTISNVLTGIVFPVIRSVISRHCLEASLESHGLDTVGILDAAGVKRDDENGDLPNNEASEKYKATNVMGLDTPIDS